MINRVAVPAIFMAMLIVSPGRAPAQYSEIQDDRILVSRTLSGHVQLGRDPAGVHDVRVELCDSGWKICGESTSTDRDGMFRFPHSRRGLYYLRFTLPGADPLLIRVRVARKGPEGVSIELTFAT